MREEARSRVYESRDGMQAGKRTDTAAVGTTPATTWTMAGATPGYNGHRALLWRARPDAGACEPTQRCCPSRLQHAGRFVRASAPNNGLSKDRQNSTSNTAAEKRRYGTCLFNDLIFNTTVVWSEGEKIYADGGPRFEWARAEETARATSACFLRSNDAWKETSADRNGASKTTPECPGSRLNPE